MHMPKPSNDLPRFNKPPSKSECLRMLRAAFGPRTRFAPLGTGLAVVSYTEEGSEYHVAEITPKLNERGQAGEYNLFPWYATLAAFRSQGYRVEKGPRGWEVVPIAESVVAKHKDETGWRVLAKIGNWLRRLIKS